ncbi:alpha/beta fold hydrolase [Roseixanthobacter pseudopolyaromaticivorans]|uniref:alpha/beta fold hydrolase n=1 Tax=Xanthobacteraceae TaxID=335928 RepID=UPI0037267897
MAPLGYTVVGNGPRKVMAAHSWLADHRTYAPMMPFLDGMSATFVFPDFRGYGRSRDREGAFSIREMGQDMLALADHLGWDRFDVVGNSMGGQAAQWLAGGPLAAGRIDSLTLLCSVPAAGFPLDEPGAAFFGAAADSAEVRSQCATAVTGGRLGPTFASWMTSLSQESATREAIAGYLRAWTSEDVSQEIGDFAGRVRIFVGAFDPVLTERVASEKISPLFPHATIAVIAGAAHYPSLETPAYTAALLNKPELTGEHHGS